MYARWWCPPQSPSPLLDGFDRILPGHDLTSVVPAADSTAVTGIDIYCSHDGCNKAVNTSSHGGNIGSWLSV